MWHLKKKRTYLQNRGRVTGVEKKTYGYQLGKECGKNKLGDWN